jgi:hypothetical protein
MLRMCIYMHSRFVENHPIRILEDGPLISEVVMSHAHKYHLSNWYSFCQKKDKCGLGIPDLRDLNLCLLASWVQRYHEEGPKLWKAIVDYKYHTCSLNLFVVKIETSHPFGKG